MKEGQEKERVDMLKRARHHNRLYSKSHFSFWLVRVATLATFHLFPCAFAPKFVPLELTGTVLCCVKVNREKFPGTMVATNQDSSTRQKED